SVKEIGNQVFWNGRKLKKIDIQEGVEYIGRLTFNGNELTEVIIPDSVKNIDNAAFQHNKISKLDLGNGVSRIGPQAFGDNLIEDGINIPNSLKEMANHTFVDNPGFDGDRAFKLNLKDPVQDVDEIDLKATHVLSEVGISWEEAEDIDSDYKKYIGHFKDFTDSGPEYDAANNNLKKMEVVVNVFEESIEEDWNPKHFTFDGTTLTGFSQLGQKKFQEYKDLVIPEKTIDGQIVDSIGDKAFNVDDFGAKDGIQSLKLPDTIKIIGEMAFRNNNIVNLELPDSLNELGNGVFAANQELETLKLSNNLKVIPDGAFSFAKSEERRVGKECRYRWRTAQ